MIRHLLRLPSLVALHARVAILEAEVSRLTKQREDDRALAAQLADWLEAQRGWSDVSLYVRMLRRMAAGGGR